MSAFLALLKLIPGAGAASTVLAWLWRSLVGIFRWVFADWRHVAITVLALVACNHLLRIDPGLRAQRDQAQEQLSAKAASLTACETSIENQRTAARQAEAAQAANLSRVQAERTANDERVVDDYQSRIADLRARAERLQRQASAGGAGIPGAAGLPAVVAGAAGTAEAAGDRGLPATGNACTPMNLRERLIASEQAVQINALINAVEAQATVRTSP